MSVDSWIRIPTTQSTTAITPASAASRSQPQRITGRDSTSRLGRRGFSKPLGVKGVVLDGGKGRAALGLLLSAAVLLAAAPAALAALSVTRAELSGGQLRVEGQGATPNATITLDGVAMGTAASDGRFRIERSGFSSPTCGDLGGGDAVAYDANADGSIVVGRSSDAQGNYFHGFRWTVAGGMEGLPIGEATDVSADGARPSGS